MATIAECKQALEKLNAQFSKASDPPAITRSVSCDITDLDSGFHATLRHGQLENIDAGSDPSAQVTITVSSDDLVALADGKLGFTQAWAQGKVKLDASFMDLLKLRSLF